MECAARLPLPRGAASRLTALLAAWEAGKRLLPEEARRVLERLHLASRAGVDEKLASMVRRAAEASRGGSPVSLVFAVVGEWGSGKSYLADRIVEEARRIGLNAWKTQYVNLLDAARRALAEARVVDVATARRALEEYLAARGLPALVVVDEVEGAIRAVRGEAGEVDRAAHQAFFELLMGLFHPEMEAASRLRGRLHLVLALTREAFKLLQEELARQGLAGRYARRMEAVFLAPLTREEVAELAAAYAGEALGVPPERVFSDPRLLEAFHTVSQGNPGAAVEALTRVLVLHVEACGGDCICRVTPESLLEALVSITVTGEDGVPRRPVDASLASAVLEKLRGRGVLVALASSAAAPGEYSEGDLEALRAAGLRARRLRAERIGDRLAVATWASRVVDRLCAGRGVECRDPLREALSWLVHVDPGGGGYIVAAPGDARELASWLDVLGWTPARDPEEVYEALGVESWSMEGWLALDPASLARLYPGRRTSGLDFIPDPAVRERARQALEAVEKHPETLSRYVAEALQLMLERGVIPGARRGEEGFTYEYTVEYAGERATYRIPVEVSAESLHDPGAAAGRCRGSLEAQARIILAPSHEQRPGEPGCPGLAYIHVPPGLQRRLAEIAAGYREASSAGAPILEDVLRDRLEALARDLRVEEALRRAAERLDEARIVVRPFSEGLRSVLRRAGDWERAAYFLADAHRYLVAAGGGRARVPGSRVLDLVEAVAEASPYARKRYWCGAPKVCISVVDVGRGPEARAIMDEALKALPAEGLADAAEAGYNSTVEQDPIASRILGLPDSTMIDEDLVSRVFVLPADETQRRRALARIHLRLEALSHVGLARPEDGPARCGKPPKAWIAPHQYRVPHRRLRGVPKPDAVDQARRDALAVLRDKWRVEGPGSRLGVLLVYKEKDAKRIDERLISRLHAVLEELRRVQDPAAADLHNTLLELYQAYMRLSLEAAQTAHALFTELHDELSGYRSEAWRAYSRLREAVEGRTGAQQLLAAAREFIDGAYAEAYRSIAGYLERALRMGDEAVEDPARYRVRLAGDLSYRLCDSPQKQARIPDHRYSPHLYFLLAGDERGGVRGRIGEALMRAREQLLGLAQTISGFLAAIARLDAGKTEALLAAAARYLSSNRDVSRVLEWLASNAEAEARQYESLLEALRRAEKAVEEAERAVEAARVAAEEARRAVEEAARIGADTGEAAGLLREAEEALREARLRARRVREAYEAGECSRSEAAAESCARDAEEAARLAGEAEEAAREAARRAREAVGEARRRAQEALDEASSEVEYLERAARAVLLSEDPEAYRLVEEKLRAARSVLEAARGRGPLEAVAAVEEARGLLEEARRVMGEGAEALFSLVDGLRERGMELGEFLQALVEATGLPLEEAVERARRLAGMLGVRLEVNARRRDRSGG